MSSSFCRDKRSSRVAGRGREREGSVEGAVCWARRVVIVDWRAEIWEGRMERLVVWREMFSYPRHKL